MAACLGSRQCYVPLSDGISSDTTRSFVAKCVHWIESGRFVSRPNPEEQSDPYRYEDAKDGRPQRYRRRQRFENQTAGNRNKPAKDDACDPSHGGQYRCLQQELQDDIAFLGADGFTKANLLRALGDRDQPFLMMWRFQGMFGSKFGYGFSHHQSSLF